MTYGQNTLYLWMNEMGERDQEVAMIKPSEMNILEAGIPMLGV